MSAFKTDLDVINRGLQHCRQPLIVSRSGHNAAAFETNFAYDRLREDELRCNLWRFSTRRTILRPVQTGALFKTTSDSTASGLTLPFTNTSGIVVGALVTGFNIADDTTVVSLIANTSVTLSAAITGAVDIGVTVIFNQATLTWTPPAWQIGTTYVVGSVVVDASGDWWQSVVSPNLAITPASGASWRRYYGPDVLQPYDDELSYFVGDLVQSGAEVFMSLVNGNVGVATTVSTSWLDVSGTTLPLTLLYPIGSGPVTQTTSANVYRLPHGFLRQAPTDPKGGVSPYLGVAAQMAPDDWVIEGDYVVSSDPGPLLLRFVADFVDVFDMDPLFCEMLASRIADELAPKLVDEKLLPIILRTVDRVYRRNYRRAVTVDGIERGPTQPVMSRYLLVRQ